MTDPFRTVLPARRSPFDLAHGDRLLLIGSCFTEHFGDRLGALKFDCHVNPFGIVYNPVSIAACLDRLLAGDRPFIVEELFERDGLWHSWEHHGRLSHPDRAAALSAINAAYGEAAAFLDETNRLLLTLGTAEVSVHRAAGRVVANNHKVPAAEFDHRRLTVAEVVEALRPPLETLLGRRPGLKIVLTVSPVRHLRLGAVENQRSKAVLLLACAELERHFPDALYFPAYELLLDDLRDYRFYAADMVHPSDPAVDYIWNYFDAMFFSPETRSLNAALEKLRAAMAHRPFHPGSEQHRAFMEVQLAIVGRLEQEYPALDFSDERRHFQEGY
jgi:hypothetical protein